MRHYKHVIMALIAFGLFGASSSWAKEPERLGDYLIDRSRNQVTTITNAKGYSYGFSVVKEWFNQGQNAHPAYYMAEIKPGIVADRHGHLLRLASAQQARMPKIGSIITVPSGTYSDAQVRIPTVSLQTQKFVVMGLKKGQGRILIPLRTARPAIGSKFSR